MLKSVEKLVSGDAKKVGNHKTEREGCMQRFYYYFTCICEVNHSLRTFKLDNGGYNTQSTNRAINDYRCEFESLGYTEIEE